MIEPNMFIKPMYSSRLLMLTHLETALFLIFLVSISTCSVYSFARLPGLSYGYIDKTGKYQIKPQFSSASNFDNANFALVEDLTEAADGTHLSRLIKRNGTLLPSLANLQILDLPSDGLAQAFRKGKDGHKSRFTYFDVHKGSCLSEYAATSPFQDGRAAVVSNGSIGIIGIHGEFLVAPKLAGSLSRYGFSEGLLPVRQGKLFGYVDHNCHWKIRPSFLEARPFKNGYASIRRADSSMRTSNLAFINKSGKIISPEFFMAENFEEHSAAVAQQHRTSQGTKVHWGLLSDSGKWLLEPSFDFIGPLHEGLRVFGKNDLSGYIDNTGDIKIKPQFYKAGSFSESLAPVMKTESSSVTFIDTQGKEVIGPHLGLKANITFDFPTFHEGLCAIQDPLKIFRSWGYINKKGNWEIPAQFSSASPFHNGLAAVGCAEKRQD